MQEYMGSKLKLNTTFHSQTDGLSKQTIQMLKNMFRACVIDFGGHWDQSIPHAKFACNNSYHFNILITPFEALMCPLLLVNGSPTKGVMRFRKKGKFNSWFIGSFEILEKYSEVAYRLALPPSLSVAHSVFPVTILKPYHHDDSHVIQWDSVCFGSKFVL
ncbi:hypothetical protein MTR67_025572 [Solanum verrucosum]|uniref:Tf2-1-like SH3-like domain-containing protein n=1 Tax=Solanum verrucosum TaxID=315347 RepID=A0AAF0QXE2_SOLVR|nr:hypothetical protein MTR67_025572 [Solanum verrucosum]